MYTQKLNWGATYPLGFNMGVRGVGMRGTSVQGMGVRAVGVCPL